MIEMLPVRGLPEVVQGDDLGTLIAEATELRDGDVVVVAQKIVSKAEGAVVRLPPGTDVAATRRRLAGEQSLRTVVDAPWALVVQTRHGLVCANAGIDASNTPEGTLVLLPDDPDASARRLRSRLRERTGADVAVVVSDTFGRPWRTGQTDVAIGVAGLPPIRDERGGVDRQGRRLEVTEVAVADEVSAAADLVRRKADGVPVVVVRGLAFEIDDAASSSALIRDAALDLFPRGRGMLGPALVEAADRGPAWSQPVTRSDLDRAVAAVDTWSGLPRGLRLAHLEGPAPTTIRVLGAGLRRRGVVAGVLTAVLVDLGYRARVRTTWRHVQVEAGR
ncbi:MAG: coenzyme F420-0:L-glutamate ligase [Euzebyaceae bacterium]|nr:coenzyme F420-0:L-glutamate ligase [Euzebyaceae bacterium]